MLLLWAITCIKHLGILASEGAVGVMESTNFLDKYDFPVQKNKG